MAGLTAGERATDGEGAVDPGEATAGTTGEELEVGMMMGSRGAEGGGAGLSLSLGESSESGGTRLSRPVAGDWEGGLSRLPFGRSLDRDLDLR